MNRIVSGTVKAAGALAVAGGAILASAIPAGAVTLPRAWGAEATGTVSLPQVAVATTANTPATAFNASAPPLLSTGFILDRASQGFPLLSELFKRRKKDIQEAAATAIAPADTAPMVGAAPESVRQFVIAQLTKVRDASSGWTRVLLTFVLNVAPTLTDEIWDRIAALLSGKQDEAIPPTVGAGAVPFAAVASEATPAMWFAGGYPDKSAVEAAMPAGWTPPALLVVQDLFPTALSAAATFTLPATSQFEKDGTYVNHAGLAQTFPRAVRPPVEARTELQLAFDLLGRRGLVQAAAVRAELAAAIPEFAKLADAKLPATGVRFELETV